MTPTSPRLLAASISVLLSLTVLAACSPQDHSSSQAGADAITVTVQPIATRTMPILIEVVGRTEGSREIEVRSRVSGIVQKRNYVEGEPVRANAVLFQIERAPFENALQQAKSALAQDRARLEQTQREHTRQQALLAKRAVSQREADDAGTALKQAEAAVAASEARVRDAELNLTYTSVAAPIGGVSGRAVRSEGSLVTAGTDSSLLTTITQTDPVWVRFSLSESEYALLKGNSGKRAEVKLQSADGRELPGKGQLNFTGSTVDSKLGTVQARAEFPNPQLTLLPGQFVRTQVIAGLQQAIAVPQVAVMQNDQGRFVWVAEGQGAEKKAAQRKVEAGSWVGRDWIITSGLKPGDLVITDNLIKLKVGTLVKTTERGATVTAPAPIAPSSTGVAPTATTAEKK
jgi:membrane fusion protein (multidrug efflux system)